MDIDMNTREQRVQEVFSRAKEYAEAYEQTSAAGYLFNTRLERVSELLADCTGGKLLDVGCGPGMMIGYLHSRHPGRFEFFGVDRSEPMIREGRRRLAGSGPVRLLVGRIEQLPFPDAFFDVVLAMGVVEYVDANLAIREVARVVRPGGIVITTMLNKLSPYRLWEHAIYQTVRDLQARRRGCRAVAEPRLRRLYTERAYRRLLAANQLRPVDVVYYDFNLFLRPLDVKAPRKAVFVNEKLQPLARSRLRWLGTGFIVKARKL